MPSVWLGEVCEAGALVTHADLAALAGEYGHGVGRDGRLVRALPAQP